MGKIINKKSLKYGSNSLMIIVAVITITILVNVLISPRVLKNIIGSDTIKWDMTPNKLYSLGDISKEVLKNLKKDVDIYVLYNDDAEKHSDAKNIMEFLYHYEKYGHVKVQRINPEKNPGLIASIDPDGIYELNEDNIVVKCGSNVKKFYTEQLYLEDVYDANQSNKWDGEQVITGAIKYVTSDKKKVVYFSMGHEEKSVYSELKTIKSYIEKNSAEVKQLTLLKDVNIPKDAEIIVFPSPKVDLTAEEKSKVEEYLRSGGRAIFMFDYQDKVSSLSRFEDLIRNYGITINNDKVRDSGDHALAQNNYYLVVVPMNNEINAKLLGNGTRMVLPNSRSLNVLKNTKDNLKVTRLLQTSSAAVGEQVDKTKGNNFGPLDLAAVAEYKIQDKTSKIMVTGNCSFITDDIVSKSPFAVNFFMNIANWMQNSKEEIIIQPKSLENGTLQITKLQADITKAILTFLLPICILSIGLFIWLRRRHL